MRRVAALALLLIAFAPAPRLRVLVRAPISASGFVDAGKDVLDSLADVRKRLGKDFDLVEAAADADFVVIVLERGVDTGPRRPIGHQQAYLQPGDYRGYWVRAGVAAAGYSRVFIGRRSGADNPMYNVSAWGDCAKELAKEISTWAKANEAHLLELRAHGAPGS